MCVIVQSFIRIRIKGHFEVEGAWWVNKMEFETKSTTPKATQVLLRIKNSKNEIKNVFLFGC